MQIFHHILPMQEWLRGQRLQGKRIGFVPTMGALHQGHLSLLQTALAENDMAVCSIYVNPTQFNNVEDLAKYPRLMDQDRQLLEEAGCHVLFAPSDAEMYPQGTKNLFLKFHFGKLEEVMEGKFRPGHFNGVGVVVSKLFHAVQADTAYFGQKDLQQCAIVRKLTEELSFPMAFKRCPTLREADGLAMSSRNLRLSAAERAKAPRIYASLRLASEALQAGKSVAEATQIGREYLALDADFAVEYFEIADEESLQSLPPEKNRRQGVAICVAAQLGPVRLIDNVVL